MKMKKGDIVIVAVLLSVIAWFVMPLIVEDEHVDAASAEIIVNGEIYRTVALTEEAETIEIRTDRGYNVLRVSASGIEMIEADCPDQLCLGFGHVHHNGDTIVCLPNRIFVEVVGAAGSGDDIDAIVS